MEGLDLSFGVLILTPMSKKDYYEVLGVDRSSDPDVIKKAYRKKAMKFHPDKNPDDPSAEEKFKEAAEAYSVLSDPSKKQQYDQFGHAGVNGGFGGSGGFQDASDIFNNFSDIFGDFFGGAGGGRSRGRSRTGPQRGSDLRYFMDVSFKDSYLGAEKEIEFESETSCSPCKGTGAKPGSSPISCLNCGGSGQVVRQQGFFSMATTCGRCKGTGQVISDPCHSCAGAGREEKKRKLKVTIPAGVESGTQLRLSGEGDGGLRGGPSGDLYVAIRLNRHKDFRREGLNLIGKVKISYLQAILGAEIMVKTLEGEEELKIPHGTQPKDILRVRKRGFKSLSSETHGDLHWEVDIEFPTKLDKKDEELLREIAQRGKVEVADSKKGWFK